MFKNSILRIKQLGLVDLREGPRHQARPERSDQDGRPGQRQGAPEEQHPVHGRLQRLRGHLHRLRLLRRSTSSGAGETLELNVQQGKLVKNYCFGFSEPYLFDKPITAGFNIYNRKTRLHDLQSLQAEVRGHQPEPGDAALRHVAGQRRLQPPAGPRSNTPRDPYYRQHLRGVRASTTMSSITPTLYRSTIDSPLTPTRGTLYSAER
ncbi:MAG: BamA/TamA family outer membrane protein [Candidatus Moduliflexus flocculans]|nr:BamA/TamA family outer membrane protein [Candidatus Moduliflexus flocculans]